MRTRVLNQISKYNNNRALLYVIRLYRASAYILYRDIYESEMKRVRKKINEKKIRIYYFRVPFE